MTESADPNNRTASANSSGLAKLLHDIDSMAGTWLEQAKQAMSLDRLESLRVEALGRKGPLMEAMRGLGALAHHERQQAGQSLNRVKDNLTSALAERQAILAEEFLATKLKAETLDISLPPALGPMGTVHPVTQVIEEIIAIFGEMGFKVAEGPDIEDDYHNFTALNIPAAHPARQMHDTFYLEGEDGQPDFDKVLRTHTSPGQVRVMAKEKPPIRVIVPGRTYRSDSDMTHTPMFHQVEGLVIDEVTHFGHLKGTLQDFCAAFFEIKDVPLRFRPSYFPFTEPSAEVDIAYGRKENRIVIGGGSDWLEILGCGMVHPNVLRMAGLDPEKYQGFAFGMGVERLAMLKYGIPDLRTFFDSDVRWLSHYGFPPMEHPSLLRGLNYRIKR